jgi:histidyl-tRNA synthetase
MRRADRISAEYVFILGDEEIDSGRVKWKKLGDSSNGEILLAEIMEFILK